MDYTKSVKYFNFLCESMEEQTRFERCIKEATIIVENKNITKALSAMNEADFSFVKAKMSKFLEFVKKIWAKFVENMNSLLASNQAYLDKYKDIILKRRMLDAEWSLKRYDVGIERIAKDKVPGFVTSMLTDGTLDSDEGIQKLLLKNAGSNFKGTEDFADYCKDYFTGGGDEVTIKSSQLNVTDMFNFCRDKNIIYKNVEADKNTIEKSANSAMAAINSYVNAAVAKKSQQAAPTANGESAVYSALYEQYITEAPTRANVQKPNAPAANTGNNQQQTAPGSVAAATKQGIDNSKVPNAKDQDTANKNAAQHIVDRPTENPPKNPEDEANEKVSEVTEKIDRYTKNCQIFLAAKLTAIDNAYKDYMFIIKTHVKDQLGESAKPSPNTDTQTGTNYTNK